MNKKKPDTRNNAALLKPRDASLHSLGSVSQPLSSGSYKRKLRSVQTPGGHHLIPLSEIDRLLYRTRGKNAAERSDAVRRVSGRNQLVGRVDQVRISGLMAEVQLSIGEQQITSIITATSARNDLKAGQTAIALIKSTEVMILRTWVTVQEFRPDDKTSW